MTKRLNFLALKNGGVEGLIAVETWIEKSFDCSNSSGCACPR